ncbi:target of rapamycin, partial [Tanacetum coccineum]
MSMGQESVELEPELIDPKTEFFKKVGIENRPKNRKISNLRTGTGSSGSGSVLLGSSPVLGFDPILWFFCSSILHCFDNDFNGLKHGFKVFGCVFKVKLLGFFMKNGHQAPTGSGRARRCSSNPISQGLASGGFKSSSREGEISHGRKNPNTIHGNDGEDYVFLLKGHEDLRQDERELQPSLLLWESQRHYYVVAIVTIIGLKGLART